jgi:hypothetical protein
MPARHGAMFEEELSNVLLAVRSWCKQGDRNADVGARRKRGAGSKDALCGSKQVLKWPLA